MIFSLPPALINTASKVVHLNEPVAYSWGNVDALHKWIQVMNKKQAERAFKLPGSKKYPLIWLSEGWEGSQSIPGYKFENVTFYISCNSNVETINENRIPNFDLLYKVANDFIKQLKLSVTIGNQSIKYTERANFSTIDNKKNTSSYTIDIWDTLIVRMNLIVNTNCIKKLCSP